MTGGKGKECGRRRGRRGADGKRAVREESLLTKDQGDVSGVPTGYVLSTLGEGPKLDRLGREFGEEAFAEVRHVVVRYAWRTAASAVSNVGDHHGRQASVAERTLSTSFKGARLKSSMQSRPGPCGYSSRRCPQLVAVLLSYSVPRDVGQPREIDSQK